MRAADHSDPRPSGIRWPRFVPRHSRFHSAPGGTLSHTEQKDPGDVPLRNPITGIAFCCARRTRAEVNAPPRTRTNARRLIRSPHRRGRRIDCGIVSPSALAVLRLMTSSNPRRPLDRQIGRLGTRKNPADIDARPGASAGQAWPVADQAASLRQIHATHRSPERHGAPPALRAARAGLKNGSDPTTSAPACSWARAARRRRRSRFPCWPSR